MRAIDADTVLLQLSDDLAYKSSVKRVLLSAPTVDVAKKIFEQITLRFNEAEYEMENFISSCRDSDACADCQDRLDGLRYAIEIVDEVKEQFMEEKHGTN